MTIGAVRSPELAGLAPGDYVRVSVIDNGVGMTPEVLRRAGEPFFTTKPPGEGTGLGLAGAYGLAKQSDGHLTIASEVGKGTAVSIYLPRVVEDASTSMSSTDRRDLPLGDGETVLVVDDDDEVREVTLKRLESLGYAVIAASNGRAAVALCGPEQPIALALIDIVMPGGMSGYDVARALGRLRPDIKILLTSGYDGDAREGEPGAIGSFTVLDKPYDRAVLARAVAEALAG
jgi:CheY-like chemotaxis protein